MQWQVPAVVEPVDDCKVEQYHCHEHQPVKGEDAPQATTIETLDAIQRLMLVSNQEAAKHEKERDTGIGHLVKLMHRKVETHDAQGKDAAPAGEGLNHLTLLTCNCFCG